MAPPGSPRVLLAGNPPWEREASGITVVCGVPVAETTMGWLAMTLLVFQGTALSLTLRYSRTQEGPQYLASVAVIWTEAVKLLLCLVAQGWACRASTRDRGVSWAAEFTSQAADILSHSMPMALPAALFVMQQVLVIVAASHLDAVTFQICSQAFKILPTAVFAALLLGQKLTGLQWASLPVLAAGIVFITLTGGGNSPGSATALAGGHMDLFTGITASAFSGLSSAFAGVYFEKYVKGSYSRSLTVRNLQLSLFGLPFSLAYAMAKDGRGSGDYEGEGLMRGFDALAWTVVALQVQGGLLVALVVKYADNILKNFANALAVVFVVLFSIPLFGQWPSAFFLVGVAIVVLSMQMYGATPAQADRIWRTAGKVLQPLQHLGASTPIAPFVQWVRAAAGPAVGYGAALLLALAGAATILLVVAASTQHVPLYSPGSGLHLMSAGDLEQLAALTNRTTSSLIQQ
eukprot:CAMPEP_0206138246 /NCGR_PEP_ID=MMETSP1473-20131121/3177_1 /ASSEMBLY_ACC=CAM_ASM_001109 /TAXON_ID=1461547 /ORGANISM="Stichococcus sp, Strain RCC1054" /LENGTH=460 /DNA_ID=CAMNT_0053531613 /DNA_START=554 /DNA_END=1936 /DNA_ORIENTATION=-